MKKPEKSCFLFLNTDNIGEKDYQHYLKYKNGPSGIAIRMMHIPSKIIQKISYPTGVDYYFFPRFHMLETVSRKLLFTIITSVYIKIRVVA